MSQTEQIPSKISHESLSPLVDGFPHWYIHQSLKDLTTPARVLLFAREACQCDRATLLEKHGSKWRVVEVSGVTKIHRHSTTTRAIEKSVAVLLAPYETVVYPLQSDRSPLEEEAIDGLLDSTGANSWLLIPLEQVNSSDTTNDSNTSARSPLNLALLLERFSGDRFELQNLPLSEMTESSSVALANWRHLKSIPGARTIAHLARWLGPAYRWKLAIVSAAMMTLLCCSLWFEKTHWVEATGRLSVLNEKHIYAPSAATVSDISVEHGDTVEEGQLLFTLQSSQLKQLERDLTGQIQLNQQRLLSLQSVILGSSSQIGLNTGNATHSQSSNPQHASEIQQISFAIDNLETQLSLVREDIAKLKIVAPFKGRVTTWNVKERLNGRPVRIGDWLATVEPLEERSWRVELDLSPRALGAISERQDAVDPPRIRFRIGSMPDREWETQIAKIASATQADAIKGNITRVQATIAPSPLHELWQSGAEVRAFIDGGKMSWFHSAIYDLRHWWNYRVASYFTTPPAQRSAMVDPGISAADEPTGGRPLNHAMTQL